MTATELLDSLWQAAYRNKDDSAMGYLAQLRDPVAELQADNARISDAGERLAARLRLWSISSGDMMCSEDADSLREWDSVFKPAMNTNQ